MNVKTQFGSMGSFHCVSPGDRTRVSGLGSNHFAKPSCWPILQFLRLPQGWIRNSHTPDFLEKPLTKVRDRSPLMQTRRPLGRCRYVCPSLSPYQTHRPRLLGLPLDTELVLRLLPERCRFLYGPFFPHAGGSPQS